MFARVSTYQENADSIAEATRRDPDTLRTVEAMTGFKGAYYLVDRTSGKTLTITLWDSQDAMNKTEEQANQIRADESAATGSRVLGVERYEVLMAELR